MNIVHYILTMPKLIPRLKTQILETAERMFIREGYEGVSMRRLAAEVNVAVGTLYNYFPDKATLFLSLMDESWNRTFGELEKIPVREEDLSTARRRALEIIYNGIEKRGGFAGKIFQSGNMEKHSRKLKSHNPLVQKKLVENLHERLKPLGAGFSGADGNRLVQSLLASIRFFIFSAESSDRERDIDFLLAIVEMSGRIRE